MHTGERLLVRQDALDSLRREPITWPSESTLDSGTIRVRIDRFALTANNISYGVFGRSLRYWDFFPAPEGWGCLPVWGFGDVVSSGHPEIEIGTRLYGFWPMATHVELQADARGGAWVLDAAEHRRELPIIYNQYARCTDDPAWAPELEDLQSLFRPLFTTAFLVDDFLADHAHFTARQVVLSSASSKTAMGTAWCMQQRGEVDVIGLTSAGHRSFVEDTGLYHRVLGYDDLNRLDADCATVFIDLAGNAALRSRLHRHFGDALTYSGSVGGSHWQERGAPEENLPGATPRFFFAPDQAARREADWGPGQVMKRVAAAAQGFLSKMGPQMRIVRHCGPEAAERIYRETLAGEADPAVGHIVSLWPEP